MDEQLSIPMPVIGLAATAYHEEGHGWVLRIQQRRYGGGWETISRYERLVRPELADVLLVEVLAALELQAD